MKEVKSLQRFLGDTLFPRKCIKNAFTSQGKQYSCLVKLKLKKDLKIKVSMREENKDLNKKVALFNTRFYSQIIPMGLIKLFKIIRHYKTN